MDTKTQKLPQLNNYGDPKVDGCWKLSKTLSVSGCFTALAIPTIELEVNYPKGTIMGTYVDAYTLWINAGALYGGLLLHSTECSSSYRRLQSLSLKLQIRSQEIDLLT